MRRRARRRPLPAWRHGGAAAALAARHARARALGSLIRAAPTARRDPNLLLGHRGHRQVAFGGDAAAAAGALLDARHCGDVGEHVGDLDEVRAGVAAEADDLDADALLLDGADGRREVAVTGDDHGDVELLRHAHHVDDELDVEVGLDAAVAVLADVLADDLVAAARQEGMELALVLVLGVEAGVGVGAHEVATGGGRLEEGDVVDVHACGLGRIEDVRDVNEDGDVLAHAGLLCVARRSERRRMVGRPSVRSRPWAAALAHRGLRIRSLPMSRSPRDGRRTAGAAGP